MNKLVKAYTNGMKSAAMIAEGFPAAVNSEAMSPFVEAGVVQHVMNRDLAIGTAIRNAADVFESDPVSEPDAFYPIPEFDEADLRRKIVRCMALAVQFKNFGQEDVHGEWTITAEQMKAFEEALDKASDDILKLFLE